MKYHLRLPIFEFISEHEIKLKSGGRLSEAIVLSLFAPLVAGGFGFAFYVDSGAFAGIVSAVIIGGLMGLITRMSFKTPKYYVFNVKTELVTCYPSTGSATFSSIDASSIRSSRHRYGKFSFLELYMFFNGEEALLARYGDTELTKATSDFFIGLLKKSLKKGNVNDAFSSLTSDIEPIKSIFKEFHSFPLWKSITYGLGRVFLYMIATIMILVVGAMILIFIHTVVTG
jgi:hypothetical protein